MISAALTLAAVVATTPPVRDAAFGTCGASSTKDRGVQPQPLKEVDRSLFTASKDELIAKLLLPKITDEDAQSVFFQIRSRHTLTADDERRLLRFLTDEKRAVFGVAAAVLARSKTREVLAALHQAAKSQDQFVRFSAAAALWREQSDPEPIGVLRQELLDPSRPLAVRRELAWRFVTLENMDATVLATYVDLLDDPEQWMRYNAIKILAREAKDTLGYDFRAPKLDAVARWRTWLATPRALDRTRYGTPIAGVGFVLCDGFIIKGVMAGLPADRAGIVAGDVLLSINDDPVDGKMAREVQMYELHGDAGEPVKLKLHRREEVVEVTLIREELRWTSTAKLPPEYMRGKE